MLIRVALPGEHCREKDLYVLALFAHFVRDLIREAPGWDYRQLGLAGADEL